MTAVPSVGRAESMRILTCPHCRVRVAPPRDGICPSCRRDVSGDVERRGESRSRVFLRVLPSLNRRLTTANNDLRVGDIIGAVIMIQLSVAGAVRSWKAIRLSSMEGDGLSQLELGRSAESPPPGQQPS